MPKELRCPFCHEVMGYSRRFGFHSCSRCGVEVWPHIEEEEEDPTPRTRKGWRKTPGLKRAVEVLRRGGGWVGNDLVCGFGKVVVNSAVQRPGTAKGISQRVSKD